MASVDIQVYPKVPRLNHEGSTPSSSSESLRLNPPTPHKELRLRSAHTEFLFGSASVDYASDPWVLKWLMST